MLWCAQASKFGILPYVPGMSEFASGHQSLVTCFGTVHPVAQNSYQYSVGCTSIGMPYRSPKPYANYSGPYIMASPGHLGTRVSLVCEASSLPCVMF